MIIHNGDCSSDAWLPYFTKWEGISEVSKKPVKGFNIKIDELQM